MQTSYRVVALALITIATSSCANMAPVKAYSDQTVKLSAAFEPMLEGSQRSCTEKFIRKKRVSSPDFNAAAVRVQAEALCKPIADDNQVITELNQLLISYATTLSALSAASLATHKTEFDSLQGSLTALKNRDGETLLDADKVTAITALATFLADLSGRRLRDREVRTLLDKEAGVFALVDALALYADLNYGGWLKDEMTELDGLEGAVDWASEHEPLAANQVRAQLQEDRVRVQERQKAVATFLLATQELKKTHQTVRANIGNVNNAELLRQLQDYAKQVESLRKQLRTAYGD